MKIAVLVLAHKNVAQISALVKLLSEEFDVYVHLDAKSTLMPEQLPNLPGVNVMKKHRIRWGSLSMVEATLSLMQHASASNYDRYVLISGQDIPIRPLPQIRQFFENNLDKEFVGSLNLRSWNQGGLERLSRYHSPSHLGAKGLVKHCLKLQSYVLSRIQDIFNIERPLEIEFYCGPQWVDLTGGTVRAILKYLESNRWLLNRLKWTACSDEIFFPTILNQLNLGSKRVDQTLRYVDWSECRDSPKLLGYDDLESLKQSDALFARKFEFVDESTMLQYRAALLGLA